MPINLALTGWLATVGAMFVLQRFVPAQLPLPCRRWGMVLSALGAVAIEYGYGHKRTSSMASPCHTTCSMAGA